MSDQPRPSPQVHHDADMFSEDGGRTWHAHCLACGFESRAHSTLAVAEAVAASHEAAHNDHPSRSVARRVAIQNDQPSIYAHAPGCTCNLCRWSKGSPANDQSGQVPS